jgi:hypothetical protein
MRLTRRVLVVLVLAAWAGSLAQSDARPRGAKHAATPARPAGQQHAVGGAAKRRDNARPAIGRTPVFTPKNAIGVTTAPAGIGPPAPSPARAPYAAATNPLGARPGTVALPAGPAGAAKTAAPGVHPGTPPPLAHGGGISGTGMTRPGSTPGVIGGPAKIAGGISGTGMKPKR